MSPPSATHALRFSGDSSSAYRQAHVLEERSVILVAERVLDLIV